MISAQHLIEQLAREHGVEAETIVRAAVTDFALGKEHEAQAQVLRTVKRHDATQPRTVICSAVFPCTVSFLANGVAHGIRFWPDGTAELLGGGGRWLPAPSELVEIVIDGMRTIDAACSDKFCHSPLNR